MKKLIVVTMFLCLLGTARPADASVYEVVKAAAELAYTVYNDYLRDELTLETARDEILAAIAASQGAILDHMDNLEAVEARACSTQTVADFERFDEYTDPVLQRIVARDMEYCVFLINDIIVAAQDPAVIDELGFAVHNIGPMALVTLEQVGLSPYYVENEVIAAEAILYDALMPSCSSWRICEPGARICECFVRCVAYNGDVGFDVGVGWEPDRDPVIADALRNTSAAISTGL